MRRVAGWLVALAVLLPQAAHADALADVMKRGSLRVAVAEGVPWMMHGAGGEPIGFSVDLASRLASDLGVGLELVALPFAQLMPAVAEGRADVAASGLSITAQRALRVDFSAPLGTAPVEVVARLDADGARYDLDELDRADAKIGFEAGTLFEDLARVRFPNAELAPLASEAEARSALLDGRVHALVATKPLPELLARENAERLFRPGNARIFATAEGLAVRRGEAALLRVIDAWIVEQKASGFLARTRIYWFEDREWLGRLSKPLRETAGDAPAAEPDPAPAR